MAKLTKQQLDTMTKEQKLAYFDALQERKRRNLERRDGYVPNAGQLSVHASKKRNRFVFAGNGGGKTALGANEAIWSALGFNPETGEHTAVPAQVYVVLDKPEKVEKTWLPEIKKWYPLKPEQQHKRGKPYISSLTFDNGSELTFLFHDQEPMTFESLELDFVVFDEPPPRHIFIALMRGGRKKGRQARFLIIGTPLAAPWLRSEIYEPWSRGELPDTDCFRYGTAVNAANLADGYMEDFGRFLSEKEKAVRFEGAFFDADGLALAHLFKRSTHLVPRTTWPASWPVLVVIDPAMAKPHVAILLGITPDDSLLYLKELSLKCEPRKFGAALKEFYKGYRVVDIVCDSLGSSELSGGDGILSFIQVLRDMGIRVRATTYDEKQDEAWIEMIQEALALPLVPDNYGKREPRLKFVEDCKGIIADIETVTWEKYRNEDEYKPKLSISKKDYLACVKYGLAAQPRFSKGNDRVIRGRAPAGLNNAERFRQPASKVARPPQPARYRRKRAGADDDW